MSVLFIISSSSFTLGISEDPESITSYIQGEILTFAKVCEAKLSQHGWPLCLLLICFQREEGCLEEGQVNNSLNIDTSDFFMFYIACTSIEQAMCYKLWSPWPLFS